MRTVVKKCNDFPPLFGIPTILKSHFGIVGVSYVSDRNSWESSFENIGVPSPLAGGMPPLDARDSVVPAWTI